MFGGSGRAYACGGCGVGPERYGPAGAREDEAAALDPPAAYCADKLVCDDDGDGAGEDDDDEPLARAGFAPLLGPEPLPGSRSFDRPDS